MAVISKAKSVSSVLVCGCSYTSGAGFVQEKNDPGLWVNLLHARHKLFQGLNLINVSRPGRSNAGIFQDAMWNLANHRHRFAIIAWTSMPRLEIELGLEPCDTRVIFAPNSPIKSRDLRGTIIDQDYLNGIRDRLLTLIHLHSEIRTLIYYINCLVPIATLLGTQIFFINALCPWDQDYFIRSNAPIQLTRFTEKNIIYPKNRGPDDIFHLYNKMHDEYAAAGGIQPTYWLNLYSSLRHLQIDNNTDNLHPGYNSNQIYYQVLDQALQQMI